MDLRTGMYVFGGTLIPACLASWLLGFVVRRWAPRWGLMDRPGGRKIHDAPTPLGGGLAVWGAVTAYFVVGGLVLAWLAQDPSRLAWAPDIVREHAGGLATRGRDLALVLIGGTLLMLLGLWDDRFTLRWQLRLFVQLAVAAVLVISQDDQWQVTAFLTWRPATWALSILWIAALVNSFNMLDNMNGLSAGVAAVAGTMLAIFLLFPPLSLPEGPQLFVGGFLLVLVGALLGFLWHNHTPARLFLGDAGSYFIGFSIAVATMVATFTTYDSPSPHAVFAPLCVMAVPLYDMFTVIAIRIREGRSPFDGDRNHFSHRLVDLGFTRGRAVLTIYLTSATCGLGALLLPRTDVVGAVVVMLLIAGILWLIQLLEFTARRNRNSQKTP